jgi:hypothetical protein
MTNHTTSTTGGSEEASLKEAVRRFQEGTDIVDNYMDWTNFMNLIESVTEIAERRAYKAGRQKEREFWELKQIAAPPTATGGEEK